MRRALKTVYFASLEATPKMNQHMEFHNANRHAVLWGVAVAWVIGTVGCSNRPARIVAPPISASSAAAAAMKQCDANSDGSLSLDELKACPAILSSIGKYDANGDKQVSAQEIEARIKSWSATGVGIAGQVFYVYLDGRPFSGARVELAPEPFFDDLLYPAASEVSDSALCSPTMASEHLPEGLRTGVYCGLYRVKITHPQKAVPARYNEQTELGIEICHDSDVYNPLKFQLKSK